MSISSSRIADFLSRAQNITEKSKVLEQSKPVLNPLRTVSNSPLSMKKSELSPISHQSFTSTHDDTPIPNPRKFILSGPTPNKKNISVPPVSKLEKASPRLPVTKERTETPSKRDSISSEASLKRPEKTQTVFQPFSEKKPENLKKISEIQTKGKKKLQKIVEIFKEEALKTDSKLKQLQIENLKLKEIINSPQLPSSAAPLKTVKEVVEIYASEACEGQFDSLLDNLLKTCRRILKKTEDFEKKIPNWFECLEIKTPNFQDFLNSACRKIQVEQKRRDRAEEETAKMIEFEENCIRELEARILNAETLARKGSCGIIPHEDEENDFQFNREQATRNLNSLITKNADFLGLGEKLN
jgi:hypothetical protein